MQICAPLVVYAGIDVQHIAAIEYHQQHIVEIVCDTAGQLSNRLYFLRLYNALFHAHMLCDIHTEPEHAHWHSRINDDAGITQHLAQLTIGADETKSLGGGIDLAFNVLRFIGVLRRSNRIFYNSGYIIRL